MPPLMDTFISFKFSLKCYLSVDLRTALKWDFSIFKVEVNVTFTDIYRMLIDFSFVQ